MAFVPQNFVQNSNNPTINAAWLNGVDVTCNFVLNGAATVSQALTALGFVDGAFPLTIAQGGTGATTAAAGLTALGGITPTAAFAADAVVLSTAETYAAAQATAAQTAAQLFTSTSYAPLASPALTGTPTAPTVALANSTTIATLGAVFAAVASGTLANPGFVKIPLSGGGTFIVNFGSSGAGATVVYAQAFSTLATLVIFPVTSETVATTAQSLTGFTFVVGGGVGVTWIAVGY
jgi:hypothetical protein